MQEVFEKIIENLEERSKEYNSGVRLHGKPEEMHTCEAIEIVKQAAADYNDGWIPCSSGKLPKENEYVRATIWCGSEWIGCYRDGKWFVYGSAGLAEATVLAWQPTEPYQPKGE